MNYSALSTGDYNTYFPAGTVIFLGGWVILLVIIAAAIALKGFALWRAARNNHKGWFVVMLIVNLVGIPEIIYLLTTGKEEKTAPVVTVEEKK